mgnify:CR=1 FL=1
MNIYFVDKASEGDTDLQVDALRKYANLTDLDQADVIYLATIRSMHKALAARNHSGKPLAVYCWDFYSWAKDNKKHDRNDWNIYEQLLREADIVFVPSKATQLGLYEMFNIDSLVVHTGINTYEGETKDAGYILDPVRYYPEEQAKWPEQAASELGIPFIHSEHKYSLEEFREVVRNCTFMTCPYKEASTGGLTLMEGLYHGKQSLVSNSPYMGAKDYVGKYGVYFKHDSYEDFKENMLHMWTNRKIIDVNEARNYIANGYTFDNMAYTIYKHLCELTKNYSKE